MARVSISDVAASAGVSKATVSNFLNNRLGKLSKDTQKRIGAVIQELGYYPSLGAQRLSKKAPSHAIGIILEQTSVVDLFSTLYFSTVMRGISEGLEERGYRALLITGKEHDPAAELAYVKGLAGIVDGFMIFNVQEMDLFVEEFERLGIAYVCVGRIMGRDSQKYVATDYRSGIKEAVAHLISLGHKRIAMVAGRPGSIVTAQIRQGYLAALREAAIEVDRSLIVETQSDTEELYDKALGLLDGKAPTAFIVGQPQAMGVHRAIEQRRLKIPADVSMLLSQYYATNTYEKYAYTYLEAPLHNVGYSAVARIVASVEEGEEASRGKLLFPMRLVIGKTTAKAAP
jgi:DNA-binding LacI/PurR family transcriptional regulator